MKALTVGDAARQLGLAADTLRYYDRIGLLRRAARRDSSSTRPTICRGCVCR